jgi:hypothetical protein
MADVRRLLAAASLVAIAPVSMAMATQRTATLAVSVQVVDACGAATGPSGLAGQSCTGSSQPIAVHQEAPAAAQSATSGSAIERQAEGTLITVIY